MLFRAFLSKLLVAIALGGVMSASYADEASVKSLLSKKYKALQGNLVVKKLPFGGLYEVNLLGQEAYTNEKVEFLLVGGSLIDAEKIEDVTASRRPAFLRDFFLNLPVDKAIKTVYGKGENVLVSFEDPDCPLCMAQHEEWAKNPAKFNATVYTFIFPLSIHPDAKNKAEYLLCQKDVASAWKSWMGQKKGLPLGPKGVLAAKDWAGCEDGKKRLAESEGLARSLGYRETPRFIFANGLGANSVLSVDQFSDAFKKVNDSLTELDRKKNEMNGREQKKPSPAEKKK